MKPLFPLLALAALLAGCVAPSGSVRAPLTLEQRFQKADADNNGRLTRDEFTDYMVENVFVQYDRGGKGYVTLEDYVAGGGKRADFARINRSGTGRITLEEAKASPLIRRTMVVPFDEADSDGSGMITMAEYQAYVARRQPYVR